ncbi:MAG: UDP-N-acetylmuramoyl-L-alanine--D-glutamate ligase [Chitinispirillaceae bacterium]|jgi:UDP-N-acetylmuramoylalanine--D-glutamate ligase|nr:UDP-N-acetylmuramoyl-L-alanine--D-glutamate ligase [Chitinispirillaceae bacterium]
MTKFDLQTTFPNRVTIIGAARSGLAAAAFFARRKVQLFISDTCAPDKLEKILADKGLSGVAREAGAHTEKVLDSDCIILSPGVPSDIPLLIEAGKRAIPVLSEMELGFRASKAAFLAITGSTGKSTTVSMLGSALAAGGKQTVVAGNIGLPVIGEVADLPSEAIVAVEVSSFQLETIDRFRPLGAAVLNLMKNHLDRYPGEEDYYSAKKEIAKNFTKDNYLVLNRNDEKLVAWAEVMKERTSVIWFSGAPVAAGDAFWYDSSSHEIRYRLSGNAGSILDVREMLIGGLHNYENAAAAAALAKVAGISDSAIGEGIARFAGLPHRLEFAGEIGGVRFYNDSKSTTAESVACAVAAFGNNVHLIAGGRDKGCDFTVVRNALQKHVKDICLIGEASARMQSVWKGIAPIFRPSTLEEAVTIAAHQAMPGDVVVFSPGCSSFDMFANYDERGRIFKRIVSMLKPERGVS